MFYQGSKKVLFYKITISLWFDIYTGDIYFFSRRQKRFVEISEETSDYLLNELREYFM